MLAAILPQAAVTGISEGKCTLRTCYYVQLISHHKLGIRTGACCTNYLIRGGGRSRLLKNPVTTAPAGTLGTTSRARSSEHAAYQSV